MRVKQDIISSKISDFQIGERTFEIGGKNKGQQQITGAKAQHGLEGLFEQAEVPVGDDLADKIVAHRQGYGSSPQS